MDSTLINLYIEALRESGRYVGAGAAAIGISGGGVGIGLVFQGFLVACARNPRREAVFFRSALLGFALAEATGLLALMVSFLVLYA